jgi:parallel beta-helix repeat protein
VFAGAADAGRTIDCGGGWLAQGEPVEVRIQSLPRADGGWERPDGLRLRNCRLRGAIRIIGLGRNGEAEAVRRSSRLADHSRRTQAAAPRDVVLERLELEAVGPIPVYAGPGTTGLRLSESHLWGRSRSVAIYLDAESAGNRISGNRMEVATGREVIAVDGSAGNRIEGNGIRQNGKGGIFVYRNCGEGGTARHQAPTGNAIRANRFSISPLATALRRAPDVWLGSRGGRRLYCFLDGAIPYGSGRDDGDHAEGNVVEGNVDARVRDDGRGNQVRP